MAKRDGRTVKGPLSNLPPSIRKYLVTHQGKQSKIREEELLKKQAILGKLVDEHAPSFNKYWLKREKILKRIRGGQAFEMIVLAADIRRSTILMKEAIDFTLFSLTLSSFLEASRKLVHKNRGWFDKFTGDGFLAYWMYSSEGNSVDAALNDVMTVSRSLIKMFHGEVLQDFRENSRNFPEGIGLSLGLDAGPSHLVEIAGDLTIVGPAVVGAVRMVSIAHKPKEVVANVYLGEYLLREGREAMEPHKAEVSRDFRATKEYPSQEVYVIDFIPEKQIATPQKATD